jgi:hypothetical protein
MLLPAVITGQSPTSNGAGRVIAYTLLPWLKVNATSMYPPDGGGQVTDEIVTAPVSVVLASNHAFAVDPQVKVDVVFGLNG